MPGVRVEGRPLVEQQCGTDRQIAEVQVPDHPAGAGEEQDAVPVAHVVVQRSLLPLLDQAAAGPVLDALGRARGAGREEDIERVVARQAFEGNGVGLMSRDIVRPQRGVAQPVRDRGRVDIGHQDGPAEARQPGLNLGQPPVGVEDLAVVVIAVGREQHSRFDLPQAVENARGAVVGRAGGECRADRDGRERDDHRLRYVGHVGGHPVARADAIGLHRRRQRGHPPVQRRPAHLLPAANLVAEDQRRAVVAPAHQVFGEVEPRIGKEARLPHARAGVQNALAAGLGNRLLPVPPGVPEGLHVVDRPLPQVLHAGEVEAAVVLQPGAEFRQPGAGHALGRRRPHGFAGHALSSVRFSK